MEAQSKLKQYAELVDRRLSELLPPETVRPQKLHGAMRYSCLAPGKRLRPALCLASAEAVGGEAERALDAACAVEMVHAFSLIHDDLPAIDNDDLRRGRPTCHIQYGEAMAILAGDALFALAFETLAGVRHEPGAVIKCLSSLTRAVGSDGLVGGEVVDVESEGKPIDGETLEFIHTRKTGALIAAACEIGARLGGGTEPQAQALYSYGMAIGLAFQIRDDILDEVGDTETLGKPQGSDLARQKATYPALFGIDASTNKAEELRSLALEKLEGLPGELDFLTFLADFSVRRTH